MPNPVIPSWANRVFVSGVNLKRLCCKRYNKADCLGTSIAIVILTAIGLAVLLILGIYAQQQLVHTGPEDPGRQTAPSDDTDTSGPGETENSATVTENTPVTDPPEETEPETEPLRPTQPTEPPETPPPATDPPETVPQETQSPEPTEDSGMHEDEFPPVPLG